LFDFQVFKLVIEGQAFNLVLLGLKVIVNPEVGQLLLETGVTDYDTYSSGVFCAMSESEALELATNRVSSDFSHSTITFIGYAHDKVKLGAVCTSFKSG